MDNEIIRKYEKILRIGFGGLEVIDKSVIREYGRIFNKGEFIIKEGEVCKDVFLIIEGEVIITKDVNTINKVLAIIGPGEIIGEMSFFESTTRSASCIADSRVVVLAFNQETFTEIYNVHPRWFVQVLESLSKRIIKTYEVLKERLG